MHERAGTLAATADLVDVASLLAAYYDRVPDLSQPSQRVAFGTSGHRGSALDGAFNETHIAAITRAIVEYRSRAGITGPLFIGADTHALSAPALATALAVLGAHGVWVMVDARDSFVPTPALSLAIVEWNREPSRRARGLADGILVTPSHNPPRDGGFKYNPPHGGPADTDITSMIAARANELIANGYRGPQAHEANHPDQRVERYDYRERYVEALDQVLRLDPVAGSGLRIGVDPLGGAAVDYWPRIAEHYRLDLTVINPAVDATWRFMTLDTDGQIRMDPSSPAAMASVIARRSEFDLVLGNDADADRHGIVTPHAGLMNPNHFLAAAIAYLYTERPGWNPAGAVGKTMVSSSMIDRVSAALGRELREVPVGFKWFVPGLLDGSVPFGGEESAGASFARLDGSAWTTDKDGLLLALLAAELYAVTGSSPTERYRALTERFGDPAYARIDQPASPDDKARLGQLDASAVTATTLAGEPITGRLSHAPGNGAPLGGIKVTSPSAWFAARPSGTENVYKIYAESFVGPAHLAEVQHQAAQIVAAALTPG